MIIERIQEAGKHLPLIRLKYSGDTMIRGGSLMVEKRIHIKGDAYNDIGYYALMPAMTKFIDEVRDKGTVQEGNFIIVADNEWFGIRAACILIKLIKMQKEEALQEKDFFYEEPEDLDTQSGDDELESDYYKLVTFDTSAVSDDAEGNSYLWHIANASKEKWIIFGGLSGNEGLEQKTEAVMSCGNKQKILVIDEKTYAEIPLRNLMAQEDYTVLRADAPPKDDYVDVVRYLIDSAGPQTISDEEILRICRRLGRMYGAVFGEEQILRHTLDAAGKLDAERRDTFEYEDFFDTPEDKTALDILSGMPGLMNAKKVMYEFLAMLSESMRNPRLKEVHNNMIFYGNPGSGKTVTARIASKIKGEIGGSSGSFVEADRASLIGKYVGHTAPKIKAKFEQAKGGVLFVDEAGFFIRADGDKYSSEAIKEFVRYMEIYPDVTVIFAMYKNEMEDFLSLDEGLRSRITRFIHFEDYSDEELAAIVTYILKERGYSLTKGCRTQLLDFLSFQDSKFGNGRGARKLSEAIILEHSIRNIELPVGKDNYISNLTLEEVRGGIKRFENECEKVNKPQRTFGFRGKMASATE